MHWTVVALLITVAVPAIVDPGRIMAAFRCGIADGLATYVGMAIIPGLTTFGALWIATRLFG